ncbi:MAG: hypothetical protein QXM27_01165 [Candidatus Pacearchaeota archaeon]
MKRYGIFDENIKKIFDIINDSFNENYVMIGGVSRVCLSIYYFNKYKENISDRKLTQMIIRGFSDLDLLFSENKDKIIDNLTKNKINFIYDPWENELMIKFNNNYYVLELINISLIKNEKKRKYYDCCIKRAIKFNFNDISTKILTLEDFILTKMFIKFKEEKNREEKDLDDVKNLLIYIKNFENILDLDYIKSCFDVSEKSKEDIEKNFEILKSFL